MKGVKYTFYPRNFEQMGTPERRVVVGMSGGVDSSVAALRLKQAGYEVEGLFMKNWNEDDGTEYCTAAADLIDAEAVCCQLDIPLHTANFAREYWDNVFSHFLEQYSHGRTPNPDVLCNREIKFKIFIEHAQMLGAARIATGHYARTRERDGKLELLKGRDVGKDQSYFLHAVPAAQLARALFPLGELTKVEVRDIAKRAGFHNHAKPDSTGICFIGERRFRDFLARYLPSESGTIRSVEGRVLGEHTGVAHYTIGQRQGLGVGGIRGAQDSPWYVVAKDLANNVLIVAQGNEHPALFSQSLTTSEMHWINGAPALPFECAAKTRYRQPDASCEVARSNDSGYVISFSEPQRAITPGQYVCLYADEVCLGGGVIEQVEAGI